MTSQQSGSGKYYDVISVLYCDAFVRRFEQELQNELARRLEMEDSTKTEGDLAEQVSSLNKRLADLEEKVTELSSTHEQGESATQ